MVEGNPSKLTRVSWFRDNKLLKQLPQCQVGPGTRVVEGPRTRAEGPGTSVEGPGTSEEGPGTSSESPETRVEVPGTRVEGPGPSKIRPATRQSSR